MGYACPVCGDPQADAGHLANHLAFTAILGDDDHEAWLEEHAPGWGEMGESDLADRLGERVEETDFPQLFEDTAGGLTEETEPPEERSGALFDDADHHGHEHDHGPEHDHGHDHGQGRRAGAAERTAPDSETEAALEEAREMTRRMLGETDDGDDGDESQ